MATDVMLPLMGMSTDINEGLPATFNNATCSVSLINGKAFITNCSADITPYLSRPISITDGANTATGFIGAKGTGETLSAELVVNGGFDSDTTSWVATEATLASIAGGESGNCLEVTRVSGTYSYAAQVIVISQGMLCRATYYAKSGTSGNDQSFAQLGAGSEDVFNTTASWAQRTFDKVIPTANATIYVGKKATTAGTKLFDTVSVKQVLTPSATGVTITSTRGGATQNWDTDDGLDGDAATFTITIDP